MLSLMVNGLRAGYSTMQAMEAVSRELPAPISDEFRRVVQEMQLGIPMDTSLENLTRRIPSKDLDLVVTAINVQREVGGNLAEILEKIAQIIQERFKLQAHIRVLSAEGKLSSIILITLSGIDDRIGVSMKPGQIALARMPLRPSSRAQVFTMPMTPNLVAA